MKAPLSCAPASGLLGASLLGILTGCAAPGSPVLIWTAAGCAFLFFAGLTLLKKHYPAVCAVFFGIGCLATGYALPAPPPEKAVDGRPHALSASVRDLSYTQSAQRAVLTVHRVDGKPVAPFRCLLTVGDIEPRLTPGDSVLAVCGLDRTENRRAITALEPGRFYFFARGIGADGFCAPKDITVTGRSRSIRFLPDRIRDRVAEMVVATPLSPETQNFILATVLGLRGELPSDLRSDFRQLGISHILCVSGYHVGLVAWLISVCLIPLGALGENLGRWRHLPALALVWLYILVCGAQPSAVRAGVMITVFLLGRLLERGSYPFNSLALAALAILLVNPYWLFDGGFLLSFCAVLGILLFADRLNPFPRRRHRAYTLCSWICLPLAAVLGTLPVTLMIFRSFPVYFLPANMAVALVFPLIMAFSGTAFFLWHLGLHCAFLAVPADVLLASVRELCARVADASPTIALAPSPFGIAGLAAAILALAVALRLGNVRQKAAFSLAAVLLGALSVALPSPPPPPGACLGTRRGHIVLMFHSGKNGHLFSSDPSVMENAVYHDYLRSLGADAPRVSDSVPRLSWPGLENIAPGLLVLEGRSVAYGHTEAAQGVSLLIVHRDYLPDSVEIARLRPGEVILSGTLTQKRRERYEEICRSLALRTRFLPSGRHLEL